MSAAKAKPPRKKRAQPKAAKPKAAPPKSVRPKSDLTAALAEAAWSEADRALAEAVSLSDELATAATPAQRRAALDLLQQALGRAARKRGLTRIGELGAREAYDPARHDFDAVRAPKMVRIMVRGVARGGDVLVKARAGSVVAKRK